MPTYVEWEWILAYGLWKQGIVTRYWLISETNLNFPRENLIKKCKKCGKEYYHHCIPCSFRNGGEIKESEDDKVRDLCQQMSMLTSDPGYYLENQLHWMQVQSPD